MSEPLQNDPVIKQQQEFVNWLKSREMYNQFDSAHVMQRMFEVWKILIVEQQENMIC